MELRLIKESPLNGVTKSKVDYRESEVYDLNKAIQLLQALEKETYTPYWQIIIKLALLQA